MNTGVPMVAPICEDVRYAGWAYRMKVEHIAHRFNAFCTVSRTSATTNFSFAHELGHLFGCCHRSPPKESDHIAVDAYGWGFDDGARKSRTIMHSDYHRHRVLHFSNPFIEYPHFGGEPTGITRMLTMPELSTRPQTRCRNSATHFRQSGDAAIRVAVPRQGVRKRPSQALIVSR